MATKIIVKDGSIVTGTGIRPATLQEERLYAENVLLHKALAEVSACGSGFLRGDCDVDCVSRTMVEIVRDFRGDMK